MTVSNFFSLFFKKNYTSFYTKKISLLHSLLNKLKFLDIDECENNASLCDPNAICTNKIGTFECKCRIGFAGNGFTCGREQGSFDKNFLLIDNGNCFLYNLKLFLKTKIITQRHIFLKFLYLYRVAKQFQHIQSNQNFLWNSLVV